MILAGRVRSSAPDLQLPPGVPCKGNSASAAQPRSVICLGTNGINREHDPTAGVRQSTNPASTGATGALKGWVCYKQSIFSCIIPGEIQIDTVEVSRLKALE